MSPPPTPSVSPENPSSIAAWNRIKPAQANPKGGVVHLLYLFMQGGGAGQRQNGNNSNNSGNSRGIGGGGSGGGGGGGGGSNDASRPARKDRISPPRSISNGYGSGSNSSNNSTSNGSNGHNGKGKDPHRRNFREEGLELSRSAWRQEKPASGWAPEETTGHEHEHGHAMGGANGRVKGEGGYEVVQREETLLDGESANLGERCVLL